LITTLSSLPLEEVFVWPKAGQPVMVYLNMLCSYLSWIFIITSKAPIQTRTPYTALIIYKNHIIQYSYKCWCQTSTRVRHQNTPNLKIVSCFVCNNHVINSLFTCCKLDHPLVTIIVDFDMTKLSFVNTTFMNLNTWYYAWTFKTWSFQQKSHHKAHPKDFCLPLP